MIYNIIIHAGMIHYSEHSCERDYLEKKNTKENSDIYPLRLVKFDINELRNYCIIVNLRLR